MKIKWSQTIKDIFDTFDSLYFSEEYLRDNMALSENPSSNSDIDIDDLHKNFDNYIVILSTFSLSKLEDIKNQLVEKEHYESVRKVDSIIHNINGGSNSSLCFKCPFYLPIIFTDCRDICKFRKHNNVIINNCRRSVTPIWNIF